jgi:hypothetical protein
VKLIPVDIETDEYFALIFDAQDAAEFNKLAFL